jgi:hypothetical protein
MPMKVPLLSICFSFCFIACAFGQWYRYTQPYYSETPHDIVSCHFSPEGTGYAVGPGTREAGGFILKTTDGGITWSGVRKPEGVHWFCSVHFMSDAHGFVSGMDGNFDGFVCETFDGGDHWEKIQSITWNRTVQFASINLFKIHFINPRTGYFIESLDRGTHSGPAYITYFSENSGASFAESNSASLTDICFADSLNAFAIQHVGAAPGIYYAYILKSSDGGATWKTVTDIIRRDLYTIECADTLNVFAAGVGGSLLISKDGGGHWEDRPLPTPNTVHDIRFAGGLTGFVVGSGGIILKTTDGGDHWEPQTSGTGNHLRCVHPLDGQRAVVVGDNAVVLTTSNGGDEWIARKVPDLALSSVDEEIGGSRLDSINRFECFPNPFNSSITIRFVLRQSGRIRLKAFSPTGTEVSDLYDEILQAGEYQRHWTPEGLPSGMYMIQFQCGDRAQNGKVLYVR